MADNYKKLNELDTKEFRKLHGLPVTKGLRYIKKNGKFSDEYEVVDYSVANDLMPSGSKIFELTLINGNKIMIHSDYFAEMQKNTFMQEDNSLDECVQATEAKEIFDYPSTYIVYDIETTGLDCQQDEIIEFGGIRYVFGMETERLSFFIKPSKPLSERIIKLTGITDDILENQGIEPKEAAKRIKEFFSDSVIIGHNIKAFDNKFISRLFEKYTKKSLNNDYVDTLNLSRKKYPQLNHHRLEDLAGIFGIDYSNAHRAIVDSEITHYVYELMAFDKVIAGSIPDSISAGYADSYKVINEDSSDEEDNDLVILSNDEIVGWKKQLSELMKTIISQENLPDDSLALKGNRSRIDNSITSYSICIYEADIIEDSRESSRNTIISRIVESELKSNENIIRIEPRNSDEFELIQIPCSAEIKTPQNGKPFFRIDKNSEELLPYFKSSILLSLKNYNSKSSDFACCSRFEDCSAAKKCIHPNLLFSKACEYRRNLEAGKIFY